MDPQSGGSSAMVTSRHLENVDVLVVRRCADVTCQRLRPLTVDADRIRVDRYDEADATPGQKLHDLPVVHSNWLTIFKKAFGSP